MRDVIEDVALPPVEDGNDLEPVAAQPVGDDVRGAWHDHFARAGHTYARVPVSVERSSGRDTNSDRRSNVANQPVVMASHQAAPHFAKDDQEMIDRLVAVH